jgi:uncharacterized protein (TIGR02145 family)
MLSNDRTRSALFLTPALCLVAAVTLLSGCSKKPEREAAPVTTDTLSETIDTLSETHDTLSVSVKHDTFTDTRDGQKYRKVTIGKQTWMAENLNYKPETGNSWCLRDSDSYCKKYGRLYDWKTAKTVCPEGWHLPSYEEWDSLENYAGDEKQILWTCEGNERQVLITGYCDTTYYWPNAGTRLKSIGRDWYDRDGKENGWGTDELGFSALPGGYRSADGGFYDARAIGYWWTATELDSDHAYDRVMRYANDYVDDENYDDVSNGYSVRCVADK